MAPTYDGRIIDTHYHLWDLSIGAHPWLFSSADGVPSLGDFTLVQRAFTVTARLEGYKQNPDGLIRVAGLRRK
jgi:predicted TIM-barrel fold metal-dependent hydrolase